MKFGLASILPSVLLLSTAAQAWTFVWGDPPFVEDGTGNTGCRKILNQAGTTFQYDKASWNNCCLELYSDDSCKTAKIGFSCEDWTHEASRVINAFKITHCWDPI
jgi:hypothetical protein